jgi:hypothetical protein
MVRTPRRALLGQVTEQGLDESWICAEGAEQALRLRDVLTLPPALEPVVGA